MDRLEHNYIIKNHEQYIIINNTDTKKAYLFTKNIGKYIYEIHNNIIYIDGQIIKDPIKELIAKK